MKILSGFSSTIHSLTQVVIALLGLGIVVSLLGGNVPFVSGIADNIVGLVQGLGDAGIVGLIAAVIILGFYKFVSYINNTCNTYRFSTTFKIC